MSALTALSGGRARGDLRLAMSAFCILPTYEPVVGILRDHPTVDERVAALSRLARTLGEAMPPASSR
jgi:Zn-dependent protease with chaperone function